MFFLFYFQTKFTLGKSAQFIGFLEQFTLLFYYNFATSKKIRTKNKVFMSNLKLKSTKVEKKVTDTYKAIENWVVKTYQSIEDAVVGTYQKIEDAFVDKFREEDEKDWRYCFGLMPSTLLKYFPKTDWEGKNNSSLICCTVIEVEDKQLFAYKTTYFSIHCKAVKPVSCLSKDDRYLFDTHNLSA